MQTGHAFVTSTVLVALTALHAAAGVFYVDRSHPVAADLPSHGAEDQPWLTIQYAADQIGAGDTVYVKAGTYAEAVILATSGASGAEIVFAAYPGDTVTLDGSSVTMDAYSGLFHLEGLQHVRIEGFHLVHATATNHNYGIAVDGGSWITLKGNRTFDTSSSGIIVWGSSHILIDGNEIELACSAGAASENECLTIGESSFFEISNNHVHHGSQVRGEGIDAKDGSTNGSVHHNHVHHVVGVGIYVDAWDKSTGSIDVSHNLVHDVQGNGFAVGSEQGGHLSNIRFFNNIAYDNLWTGLSAHACCTEDHPVSNLLIVNNTVHDNGDTSVSEPWGGGIFDENEDATNVVIRNNLCFDNLNFQIALEIPNPETVIVDHNLVEPFRGDEHEVQGDDHQEGDPQLADPANHNYHLLEGSPAVDTGSAVDAPSDDFDGQPRPQGQAIDIGAFEHGSLIFADGFEAGDLGAWTSPNRGDDRRY
jgi:hypothetical protein